MSYFKRVLKVYACGSVDDGKSTLIGRLLHDTDSLYRDQIDSVLSLSMRRGAASIDFSLFTDGLSDERNQGITIDVAYRYFSTRYTKFIIADTPGHFQYNRNMVSGSSDADVAIILVDITKGFTEQVLRHYFITALFKIPIIIFCINKMDLCAYEEREYKKALEIFSKKGTPFDASICYFIPVSALLGDNIVSNSKMTPWYKGPTLMAILDDLELSSINQACLNTLFSVQCIFVNEGNRGSTIGIAGKLLSGSLQLGDLVSVSSSHLSAAVKELIVSGRNVDVVERDQSALVILDSELSISRGDLLINDDYEYLAKSSINAVICCFQNLEIDLSKRYLFRVHSAEHVCIIEKIDFKYENNFVDKILDPKILKMNDIVGITIKFAKSIFISSFAESRQNGRFILIDPISLETVACGIIE